MKFKKKMKKSLTVAILAALTATTTSFAMPAGGTVVVGGDQINIGDAANGILNIGVDAHGVINWDSFSIASGETVNFNFADMGQASSLAVLNRVTGSEMSSLLGTLNATNNGHVFLVNPNGVLVGQGAVINAGNLVLSTLDISNDNFMTIFNENFTDGNSTLDYGTLHFTKGERAVAADIQIEESISNLQYLGLLGGKVSIAPNVTISGLFTSGNTDIETMVNIAAANEAKLIVTRSKDLATGVHGPIYLDGLTDVTTQTDNTVNLNGDISSAAYITAIGGSITADNAKLEGGIVRLHAAQTYTGDDYITGDIIVEATADNHLTVKDTEFDVWEETALTGGTVAIHDTAISMDESVPTFNSKVFVFAANRLETHTGEYYGSFSNMNIKADQANSINLNNLSVSTPDDSADIFLLGGKVAVAASELIGNEVLIGAGSDLTLEALPDEDGSGYYDEFYFAASGKTAAGNDVDFDADTVITANGESAIVGNKITNAGAIVSHHPFGIALRAVDEYNWGEETGTVTFSRHNQVINTGTITADQAITDPSVTEPGTALTVVAGSINNEGTIDAATADFFAAGIISGVEASATTAVNAAGLALDHNRYKLTVNENMQIMAQEALPLAGGETNPTVDDILNGSGSLPEKQQALVALIESVNAGQAAETEKAAAVKSAIYSVLEHSSLSEAEQIALISTIVSRYEATAATKNEGDKQTLPNESAHISAPDAVLPPADAPNGGDVQVREE